MRKIATFRYGYSCDPLACAQNTCTQTYYYSVPMIFLSYFYAVFSMKIRHSTMDNPLIQVSGPFHVTMWLGNICITYEILKGVTKAMMSMNRQMKLPQIQQIMQEFEKQPEIMDMKEEMMNDVIGRLFLLKY